MKERERGREKGGEVEEELEDVEAGSRRGGGQRRRSKGASTSSARKLAAGLWRLQLPEAVTFDGGERRRDRLGFKVIFLTFCGSKICALCFFSCVHMFLL